MPSRGLPLQVVIQEILLNIMLTVILTKDGISIRKRTKKVAQFSSRPGVIATTLPVRWATCRRTATIGLPVLTIGTTVATCTSARAMSTHWTTLTVLSDTLFAAQRRKY